jgi:hypothetical protein
MQTLPQNTAPVNWHDPIVTELHAIRQQLNDKYRGDLHAYSQAATANALALGFKFYTPPGNRSAATLSNAHPATQFP